MFHANRFTGSGEEDFFKVFFFFFFFFFFFVNGHGSHFGHVTWISYIHIGSPFL